jgi:rhodanese-related sulfurtransferase
MDFINQNIMLIALVVTSGVALIWPLFAGPGANAVNPGEATLLINRDDAHVIDVREAEEFSKGHLPDARHIPLSKLSERVCCASGMRSSRACGQLGKLGFTNVHNLAGGIDAWIGAGYPVKKGMRK